VAAFANLLAGTVESRPYVFVFFVCYLLCAVSKMGWVRTAAFTALTFAIALAAEVSSIHNGFPLGAFQYAAPDSGREIALLGVPLWDPLTFSILCYLGLQLAVLTYSPLEVRRRDIQVLDTIEIRGSVRVLITGAVLMVILHVLIDPVTARGERWFFGRTYIYPGGGLYFGVPLSGFAGWLLVGILALGMYQRLERFLLRPTPALRAGQFHLPFGGVLEPIVYLAIVLFFFVLTIWVDEPLLAAIAVFIFTPLSLVFVAHVAAAARHATAAEREAHRRDFPRTRALA
jgi:uncharacterized membrane protein